ncbi:hypothetical protein OAP51_03575, partial [Alphaproteobacteria bacterium]|nr:hypothetical protein [Alphaproteobacteria bacterium]
YDCDDMDAIDGKKTPELVSKITGIKLKKGQRVRLETPGGGGYGKATERPKSLHENDVAQGYVTGTKK